MRLLHSISCLSMPAEELLATCHILRTDLEATTPNEVPSDSPTQRTLQAYLQAQDVILNQVMRGVCVGVVCTVALPLKVPRAVSTGCCSESGNEGWVCGCGVYCNSPEEFCL